jgi:polysaccharide chain length determinant protein (PEP-CTERM system associated)
MLPGKTYTPEDILGILKRRIWFLLVPFAVVAATTAAVTRKLPDLYRSETLILVVPQRVPENYVKATVTTRIEDRLQSISQQILSRTNLERIVQDFNLYPQERKTGIMEDIIDQMRTRDISVDIVKGDAFKVSYVGRDPRTVMKVADRLSSLFIEENLRDREVLAEGTDQFLEAQLEDARRRLADQEHKLEEYRKQYAGQLPSQMEANLQVIQGTGAQIQQLSESLNRDLDRRLVVQRELNDLNAIPVAIATAADGTESGQPATAAQQLASAEAALAQLELKETPEHPDIKRMKRVISDLKAKADQEALAAPVTPEAAPRRPTSPAEVARQNKISDLKAELEQLDRQIAFKQQEDKQLRGTVASYQQRVEAAPTRESELTALTRDYATTQTAYQTLLAKKEDSKIAANLERRQIGEQFKLLDPARVAEKPFSPNRPMLNMIGLAAGFAIGVALVALFEYRDRSFRTEEEILALLRVNVLAVVPYMQSEKERKVRFLRQVAVGCSLGFVVVACFAVVAYTMVK